MFKITKTSCLDSFPIINFRKGWKRCLYVVVCVLECEMCGMHRGYKRDARPKRQKRKSNLTLVLFEVDEMWTKDIREYLWVYPLLPILLISNPNWNPNLTPLLSNLISNVAGSYTDNEKVRVKRQTDIKPHITCFVDQ